MLMMIDIRNNFLKMRHVPVQKRKNELKIVVKGTATRVNVAIDAKRFHDMCQQSAVNANTTTTGVCMTRHVTRMDEAAKNGRKIKNFKRCKSRNPSYNRCLGTRIKCSNMFLCVGIINGVCRNMHEP